MSFFDIHVVHFDVRSRLLPPEGCRPPVPESVPLARFKAAWNAAKNAPCNPISESNPIFVEGHVELESSVPEGSLQLDNL
jgi:hypothetical protein